MKNKRELIKGKPNTYWEIIRYFDNNKNNDQKISTWNFYYTDQANLINGTYTPGTNSINIHADCYCKLQNGRLEFGSQGISYKGTIKKDRMEGTWENSLNESGGFIGVLLNKVNANKTPMVEERFYVLWYKKAGEWLLSNWKKIITYIDDKIAKITTTYTNRCWSCHHDIKSTQHEYKIIEKLFTKWNGNEKCKIPNCNYFLCNNCHRCLCHPKSPYRHNYNRKRVIRKWVPQSNSVAPG